MTETVNAWAIRAAEGSIKGKAEKYARLFWNEKVAAIDYLGNDGPDLLYCTKPPIKDAIRWVRNESGMSPSESRVGNIANQLWRFANEVRKGDWILCPLPKACDVMIGHCISAYEYAPRRLDEKEYPYIIRVDWIINIPGDWLSEGLRSRIMGMNGLSLWEIDGKHISELESLCKLAIEHRNVPVNLPAYLVNDVDKLVGERGRSHFIEYLVTKGLEEAAEELSKGEGEFDAIINPVTNPEWATSAMVYAWVRTSRDLDNERTEEKWRDRSPS